MTPLQFLTPEQTAQIPSIQEKWRQVYLNTQPIDEEAAIAALQTAYRVMGKKGPKDIVIQPSPRAALDALQPYIQGSSQSSPNGDSPEQYGSVHPEAWQSAWISNESDPTLQNILVKGVGALRVAQEFPCTEVEALERYAVLKLDNLQGDGQGTYILKYVDPDTQEIRAVFTPWHRRTVREAIRYANECNSEEPFPMPET